MSIHKRIDEIIEQKGFTVRSFAGVIGVSSQRLGNYLKDRDPDYETLQKIVETFVDIDAGWLITGKGEMLKSNNQAIGDISNGSAVGNNINGNGINVTHNDISGLIELQKGYQEMIHKRDEQVSDYKFQNRILQRNYKLMLVQPIEQLSLFSEEIDRQYVESEYLKYKQLFYFCAMDMIKELNTTDHDRLVYFASNIIGNSLQFSNKEELITVLKNESKKDNSDFRFIDLGFNTISALLGDNLDTITPEYIKRINNRFSPFLLLLKDRKLLLKGYVL